jgi:hypothetical protein
VGQWHLKRAWSALLFADEHLHEHRVERDPVASAQPAAEVQAKKIERQTSAGNELQSFRTLLDELRTQCRNTCQFKEGNSGIDAVALPEDVPVPCLPRRVGDFGDYGVHRLPGTVKAVVQTQRTEKIMAPVSQQREQTDGPGRPPSGPLFGQIPDAVGEGNTGIACMVPAKE